jgi:hypothetical protein
VVRLGDTFILVSGVENDCAEEFVLESLLCSCLKAVLIVPMLRDCYGGMAPLGELAGTIRTSASNV